jgi:ribosomal subunit interface protein
MIRCDINGRSANLDEKMKEYIEEKIGGLDKYLPRRARENVLADVTLEDDANGREDNRYVCEVIVTVDGTKIISREATVNLYAAIDICEAKLKVQFAKYKDKRTFLPRRSRMLGRLIGRKAEPDTTIPDEEVTL